MANYVPKLSNLKRMQIAKAYLQGESVDSIYHRLHTSTGTLHKVLSFYNIPRRWDRLQPIASEIANLYDEGYSLKKLSEACSADIDADARALNVSGCNVGDALICIKGVVKAFNLNSTAMAQSVIASLAKEARKN